MRDYRSFRASDVVIRKKEPKRCLQKGDVVVESEPFAYVVDNDKRGTVCEKCLLSNSRWVIWHLNQILDVIVNGSSYLQSEGKKMST